MDTFVLLSKKQIGKLDLTEDIWFRCFRNSSKSPLASSDTREMLDADLIERKDVFEKDKYLFA